MRARLDNNSDNERVHIVAPQSLLTRVEEWRRKQPQIPNKSEALRALVEYALDMQEQESKPKRRAS